jgi:hypothetical protein
MNDEEFARRAFAETFAPGQPEPVCGLDLAMITSRGRRSARRRQGVYAAGTTALAGVVTAGVVIGPGHFRAPHSSVQSATGVSGTATVDPAGSPSASKPAASTAAPSAGVACSTDLATLAAQYLPASLHATLDKSATCVQDGNGDQTAQVSFDIPGNPGAIQITVGAGTTKVLPSGQGVGGATSTTSPGQPLGSASIESLREKKLAAAAAAAKSSPAPMASNEPQGSCRPSNATEIVCVRPVVKGPEHVIVVDLTRSAPKKLDVQVVASSTNEPPLDTQQLTSIALSLASHF